MEKLKFDVAVIGSGPAGYVCALRCAQLGLKTALIEKYPKFGGTCLNVGCIPSKALLDSSERYFEINHQVAAHGIQVGSVKLDWPKMQQRKQKVVSTNQKGLEFLFKKNKVQVFHGLACFKSKHELEIQQTEGLQPLTATHVVLATGSKPSDLPNIKIDKKRIISSTEALSLKNLPKTMVVIGGGAIGIELSSIYARLGTQVQVIEYFDYLLPNMDQDLGQGITKALVGLGIQFALGHSVTRVDVGKDGVTVEANQKGKTKKWQAEYCLLAVGRKPFTAGLNLDVAGVTLDSKGFIKTNTHLQTTNPNIYAVGDVVGGMMLAHKGEEEGVLVAEQIAGQKPSIHYDRIPNVVYTWPEVASVGQTEQQLQQQNKAYNKGQFPFSALGRAHASADILGFTKVLADPQTDEILGVHILGARAADLISEAVLAMEYKASAEDVARTCHPHPTFSESFKEACLAVDKRSLHS